MLYPGIRPRMARPQLYGRDVSSSRCRMLGGVATPVAGFVW